MSLHDLDYKKGGIFAAGVLFGTAGIKALSSKDAKNVYTKITAAVLRAKDCVLDVVSNIQENAQDIYAGAQQTMMIARQQKKRQMQKVRMRQKRQQRQKKTRQKRRLNNEI